MIINSNIKTILEERSNKLNPSHIEIGLLIGQESEISEQQTYVLGIFPTPLNINDGDNTPINLESISSIDKEWVLEYCIQVNRMLYGGISIVGFYLITSDSDVLEEKNNESFLMKLLKSFDNSQLVFNSSLKSIQFISYSKKTNLINGKSTTPQLLYRLKSTELKVINNLECEFISLNFNLPINIKLNKTTTTKATIPISKVKNNINQIFENQLFKQSVFLIENDIYNNIENNIISTSFQNLKSLNVDLLTNQLNNNYSISTKEENEDNEDIQIEFNNNGGNNITHCIAYIHKSEQVKTIIKFIKQDILKSINSRFDILSDEIMNSNNNEQILLTITKESPIELPRRVNVQWLSPSITICDYMSSNDTIDDCKKAVSDLLQIDSPKITSTELSSKSNSNSNKQPTKATITPPPTTPKLPLHLQRKPESNGSYGVVFIIAIIVLVLAFYFKK